MHNMKLDYSRALGFLRPDASGGYPSVTESKNKALYDKSGPGSDFLGWVTLPGSISESELADIEATAQKLTARKIEIFVVIGIGGSYLGSKAVIDALSDNFAAFKPASGPLVVFAGQNISEDYLFELRELLQQKEYALVVISKSGTTTEPAIAFRLLKQDIEAKYGKAEARERIIAVTDASRGALRQLSNSEGYKTYVIPDDVGGRYSVLTPVGLLPIAVAGFDIRQLVKGASDMEKQTAPGVSFDENPAARYAAVRSELYRQGYLIEIMVNYNPKLHYFCRMVEAVVWRK
jgi:glucose-6-phosphate isomerase